MDTEFEEWLLKNSTNNLEDLAKEHTTLDIVRATLTIIFITIGLVSNIITIYMISSNKHMRSKTNLLLMNFIINDALFLTINSHFWFSIATVTNSETYWPKEYSCYMHYADIGFQTNASVFLLMLISNKLNKNKRIQIKWLLIIVYPLIILNFFLNQIFCSLRIEIISFLVNDIINVSMWVLVVFKEFTNCYKKWYKNDPLEESTKFRFDIGRIYGYSWLSVLILVSFDRISDFDGFLIIALHCHLCGFYILLYIVFNDKNFKVCFQNMLRCKTDSDFDVGARVTYGDKSGGQDNLVKIHFNDNDNVVSSRY